MGCSETKFYNDIPLASSNDARNALEAEKLKENGFCTNNAIEMDQTEQNISPQDCSFFKSVVEQLESQVPCINSPEGTLKNKGQIEEEAEHERIVSQKDTGPRYPDNTNVGDTLKSNKVHQKPSILIKTSSARKHRVEPFSPVVRKSSQHQGLQASEFTPKSQRAQYSRGGFQGINRYRSRAEYQDLLAKFKGQMNNKKIIIDNLEKPGQPGELTPNTPATLECKDGGKSSQTASPAFRVNRHQNSLMASPLIFSSAVNGLNTGNLRGELQVQREAVNMARSTNHQIKGWLGHARKIPTLCRKVNPALEKLEGFNSISKPRGKCTFSPFSPHYRLRELVSPSNSARVTPLAVQCESIFSEPSILDTSFDASSISEHDEIS